jgi:hypothetical protein
MAVNWTEADLERVRERLVELVAALPRVEVVDSFGHTGLLLRGQRIAWLFANHHDDGRLALCVKAPPGELEALVAADPSRYFAPGYVRHWVGVEMYAVEPDWPEVAALLEQAWRMRAGKRATAAYDTERAN